MACAGGCGPGCCGDDDAPIQVGSGAPRIFQAAEGVFSDGGSASALGGSFAPTAAFLAPSRSEFLATASGDSRALSLNQVTGAITPMSFMPGFVALFEGGAVPAAQAVATGDEKCPVEKCSSKGTSYAFASQESPPNDTKEAGEQTAKDNATRFNDALKRACDRAAEKCKAAATATCYKDTDEHCECANAKPGDCKITKLEYGNAQAGSEFILNNLDNKKDPEAQAEAKALASVKGSGSAFMFILITVERPCSGECSPKATVK